MYAKLIAIATGIALSIILILPNRVVGQACCSAGTPLVGSLELPATPHGSWQFALSYDLNVLNDVVAGTRRLADGSRRRTTHALLWETSYGVTSTLSVTLLATAVQQERVSTAASAEASALRTRGVGDAVLLLKYALVPLTFPAQEEITLGAGGKIPLGASTLSLEGVLLPADMQPGTGAWDGILWAYVSQGFLPQAPLTIFLTASHRFTGTNYRYGSQQRGYKFGNETLVNAGGGYRTDEVDVSIILRFRHVRADRFGGFEIPNTGGWWLSAQPGVNIRTLENLSTRVALHVPLYRNLNGIQLTTTYGVTISLFYVLQR